MIHINRNADIPAAFKSEAIKSDIRNYKEYYKRSAQDRAQEKFSASINGDTKETVEAVANAFKFKCATCERSLDTGEVVSDSWRPRQNAKGLDHEFAQDHYWWLAYEWRNKYALCANCNNYKATWFPVDGKRALDKTPYSTIIMQEKALLVDPCKDNPAELLEFLKDGNIKACLINGAQNEKAKYSIDVYVLRRNDLVKARRERYLQIMDKMGYVDNTSLFVMDDIKKAVVSDRHAYEKTQLEAAFMQLLEFLNVEKLPNEYIGLARQYIHPFLKTYSVRLAQLIDPANNAENWYQALVDYFRPQAIALRKYMESYG